MNFQLETVFFREYVFVVYPDVYMPAEDTFLLAENLSLNEGERVLDMGTGCGVLAVVAAEKASKVIAVDINPYAVVCTQKNAEFNGFSAKIEARVGDLFGAVGADEKFNQIIFNAPYLPVERSEGHTWIEKAWSGGRTGRLVVDRFIAGVSRHLLNDGRILMVQSNLSDVDETLNHFSQRGFAASIMKWKEWAFEKVALIEAVKC